MGENGLKMNYEFFLNKEDQRSYSLLRYLEERPNLSSSFSNIREELTMSNFIVKKTLVKLEMDIGELELSDSLTLIISDTEVQLKIDGNYSSKILLSKYVTESLSFKIIVSFFKGEYNLTRFAYDNHVSTSVVYGTLQHLKKNLKQYQIYFGKNELNGNQKYISLFLYKIFSLENLPYYELYKGKTIKETKRILEVLEKEYSFTKYERNNFFHYLAIIIGNNGKAIEDTDPRALQVFLSSSVEKLKEIMRLSSDSITYCIAFWLYIHGKFGNNHVHPFKDTSINNLNTIFIGSFEKQFNGLNDDLKGRLYEELSIVHFSSVYFPLKMFDDFDMDTRFFKQTYPEFYYYLSEYIDWLASKYKKLAKKKKYLFFNYLILLINYVPVRLIAEPAKILIDFSYGEEYNKFIKKNLSVYVNLNVEIIDSVQNIQPDIVITNLNKLYKDDSGRVIVWLDPPRSIDWVNLTQILLDFQEEKNHN